MHEGEVLTGVNAETVRPIDAAATLRDTPMFYIAGAADAMIPYQDSEPLYHATPNRDSQLWIVPGAGHVAAFETQPLAYTARLLSFFDRFVTPEGTSR